MTADDQAFRVVWLALIVVVAVMAAAGTAVALRAAGARATAVLTGGGAAFVASVTLGLAIFQFLAA